MSTVKEGFKCTEQVEPKLDLNIYFNYLKRPIVQIFSLFILTLIIYGNTLNVPFYLDDYSSIVENTAVHQLDNLGAIWQFSQARFIGYLSFALNYQDAHSTISFHLFNISIHFLTSVSLFFLLRSLVLASKQEQYLLTLPILAALLFLIAPLQTQAITYIVQRLASLTAFFYIAAMASFVYARLNQYVLWYLAMLTFALLAFLTKQNSVTLPIAILLIEAIFFRNFLYEKMSKEQFIQYAKYFAIAIAVFVLILLSLAGFDLGTLDKMTRDPQTIGLISRSDYFATQILALWHYIYLFFLPLSLHIDYDFPIQRSLFSTPVLLAFFAHISVIIAAFLWRKKQPLILFGVLFYYLAHSVESSFLPIFDVFFEHRAYLPNLGLALLTATLISSLLNKTAAIKSMHWLLIAMSSLIFTSYAYLTFARNNVWNDPIALYQVETQLSPNKERVWAALGKYYLKDRKLDEALKYLGKALELGRKGDSIEALPTTFMNTYFALMYSNQMKKAAYIESLVPVDQLTPHDTALFYYMKAKRLSHNKEIDAAIVYFQKSLALNPNYLAAKSDLAGLYLYKKDPVRAKKLLEEVLAIDPDERTALFYLKQIQ